VVDFNSPLNISLYFSCDNHVMRPLTKFDWTMKAWFWQSLG